MKTLNNEWYNKSYYCFFFLDEEENEDILNILKKYVYIKNMKIY